MSRRRSVGKRGGIFSSAGGSYEHTNAPQAGTHPERQELLRTLGQAAGVVGSPHVRTGPLTQSERAMLRQHIAALGAAIGNEPRG